MPVMISRVSPSTVHLARQAIREIEKRPSIDEDALAVFLADPSCYLLVAVVDDQVVGSLRGYALRRLERPQPQFLLYELGVKEAWRGQGIGTGLVAAFIDEARAAGAFEVWVLTNESNPAAMAAYRKCGLERCNPDDVMLSLVL